LHTLESNGFEMRREIFGTPGVAFAELQSRVLERSRKLSPLEKGARGGEEDPNVSSCQSLQCLDALACNFCVRLRLSESLTRWIERDGQLFIQRFEVSEPTLRCGDALRYDDEKSARGVPRQRGDDRRVAGTWKPREVYARVRGRKSRQRTREFGESLDSLE